MRHRPRLPFLLLLFAAAIACDNTSQVRLESRTLDACTWEPAAPSILDVASDATAPVVHELLGAPMLVTSRLELPWRIPRQGRSGDGFSLVVGCRGAAGSVVAVADSSRPLGRVACTGAAQRLGWDGVPVADGVLVLTPEGGSVDLEVVRLEEEPGEPRWAAVVLPAREEPTDGLLQAEAGGFNRYFWVPPAAHLELGWRAWTTGRVGEPVEIEISVEADGGAQWRERVPSRVLATETRHRIDLEGFADQAVRLQVRLPRLAAWNRWLWTRLSLVTSSKSELGGFRRGGVVALRSPHHEYGRRDHGPAVLWLRRGDTLTPQSLGELPITVAFFDRWAEALSGGRCPAAPGLVPEPSWQRIAAEVDPDAAAAPATGR